MRIAVADDEEILLEYLKNTVKAVLPQAEVIPFSDTAALLAEAEKRTFDIAFLDIQMPGLDGLELARELKKKNETLNIIFVTGFDGYQGEAMEMFASGYVRKPITKEAVAEQIKHLRYPIHEETRGYAQTFGNFTFFIDGVPIHFSREKCRMALAFLVQCRGSMVGKRELSSVLFEDGCYDEKRQAYLSRIILDLQRTLEDYDMPDLLIRGTHELGINTNLFDCDLYDLLDGKMNARRKYCDEYMTQYSFGEQMIPRLNQI